MWNEEDGVGYFEHAGADTLSKASNFNGSGVILCHTFAIFEEGADLIKFVGSWVNDGTGEQVIVSGQVVDGAYRSYDCMYGKGITCRFWRGFEMRKLRHGLPRSHANLRYTRYKYCNLKERGEWQAPSVQQEQIKALRAKINTLKTSTSSKKSKFPRFQSTSTSNSKNKKPATRGN